MRKILILLVVFVLSAGCGGGSSDPPRAMIIPGEGLEQLNENALLLLSDAYASGDTTIYFDSSCDLNGCTWREREFGISQRINISDLFDSSTPVADDLNVRRAGSRNGLDLYRLSQTVSVEGEPISAHGMGFWLMNSVGGAVVGRGTLSGISVEVGYGSVVGNRSDSVPSLSATYQGAMTGVNASGSARGRLVQGDARIDFTRRGASDSFLSVNFNNISGASRSGFGWSRIPVGANGTFDTGSINGSFFGPNHEEIAGTFHAFNIVGAYGAKR